MAAYLVPLSGDLEEDASAMRIPLSLGANSIGRANVPVTDKRLSRKHLSLTTFADGSAALVVEGTNPVVVKSGDKRMKVSPSKQVSITTGDIIELIPGHHFFKFVCLPSENGGSSIDEKNRRNGNNGHGTDEGNERTPKRARQAEFNADSTEAIQHFHVPDERLPLIFRLLQVQGLPAWANTSCVSIEDVIQGDIIVAILSNYMVDMDWLMSACPKLKKASHVLVIHGEGDGTLAYMQRKKPSNWILHKPRLPISFGTHHSKAILLVYSRGVRVVVHTANLIYVDWNNKSQGLWMQDFPWKDKKKPIRGNGLENDLIDYLSVLKWPDFSASLPGHGSVKIDASFFKNFDYSDAAVRLIASVPGYHSGSNLLKWGHMKLRTILSECVFDKEFQRSPLIYQFSSLGSLDEKWLAELASSMSSGRSDDDKCLGPGDPLIIWPTVEDVRCSLEGYAAGNAIPSPQKNVEKAFLKKYWARWKADRTGRCRAMPHIKTYTRYSGQDLAWFLLTSANLSKAAWGALQKNNSQLMIRSYELGVLFLPATIKRKVSRFSCTDNAGAEELEAKLETAEDSNATRTKLVSLAWRGKECREGTPSEVITFPVPYELPPQPYSPEDVPWSWDRRYSKRDVYGQVWPRQVQLYCYQDS